MSPFNKKYLILLLILIATGIVAYVLKASPPNANFAADLDTFPKQIGPWHGEDIELSKDVVDALGGDSILYREYRNANTGEVVELQVVYRKTNRRAFIHRPEACYPAAGWDIKSTEATKVYYAGRTINTTLVKAQKDGTEDMVVYWFASGKRTESSIDAQQMRMIMDRLHPGGYGWSFIRVNCLATDDEDTALRTIRGFARLVSGPLLKVQTGETDGR
jgi:EpsI family protein